MDSKYFQSKSPKLSVHIYPFQFSGTFVCLVWPNETWLVRGCRSAVCAGVCGRRTLELAECVLACERRSSLTGEVRSDPGPWLPTLHPYPLQGHLAPLPEKLWPGSMAGSIQAEWPGVVIKGPPPVSLPPGAPRGVRGDTASSSLPQLPSTGCRAPAPDRSHRVIFPQAAAPHGAVVTGHTHHNASSH